MGEYYASQLDALFGAIADPTRRAILDRLARGEARVTEVAADFPISLNSVSKHLRMLERAGLVVRRVPPVRTSELARSTSISFVAVVAS